ncbi:MAG: organoarsenical effux MFS transporter ArsJ [Akkermansiaceae bacterium]
MNIKSYSIVTAAYWGFTMTDGALRMLVLLYFHELGYTPVQLAFLFLLYEFCGVLTNLLGGWIGSRVGLKFTLFAGLALQIVALAMLSAVNPSWAVALSVTYVMASQALSGIAKDLTKMSSKSAVKLLSGEGSLFKWVAVLTGSKNALKGVGFLIGGLLLTWLGFSWALLLMASLLAVVLVAALIYLKEDMGKTASKVKFSSLFSKSREINWLSAARMFLFAARDVWFVVALPVFLKQAMGWSFNQVGTFMAAWVIGYGVVQALAPRVIRKKHSAHPAREAVGWVVVLALVTLGIALVLPWQPLLAVLGGLAVFGVIFAVNSSLHSYLILAFTSEDGVALDVGFYYMANACGRLLGTLLSGVMFLYGGLGASLWTSAGMLMVAALLTTPLSRAPSSP